MMWYKFLKKTTCWHDLTVSSNWKASTRLVPYPRTYSSIMWSECVSHTITIQCRLTADVRRIDNPLAHWTPSEIRDYARLFAKERGLEALTDLFIKVHIVQETSFHSTDSHSGWLDSSRSESLEICARPVSSRKRFSQRR